jgi:hypothetical protein
LPDILVYFGIFRQHFLRFKMMTDEQTMMSTWDQLISKGRVLRFIISEQLGLSTSLATANDDSL